MRSQQRRFPSRLHIGLVVVLTVGLGLVAAWAVPAVLSSSVFRSTLARAEAPPAPAAGATADLILVHGRIYTLDAQKPWAEALAIRGERIVAVGGDREIR